jgi:diacylglycerol kinase family enzyme
MEDFEGIQTGRLVIESSGPAPYQLDGDPGGELPIEIRALPGRLLMLTRHDWAERNGFEMPTWLASSNDE